MVTLPDIQNGAWSAESRCDWRAASLLWDMALLTIAGRTGTMHELLREDFEARSSACKAMSGLLDNLKPNEDIPPWEPQP